MPSSEVVEKSLTLETATLQTSLLKVSTANSLLPRVFRRLKALIKIHSSLATLCWLPRITKIFRTFSLPALIWQVNSILSNFSQKQQSIQLIVRTTDHRVTAHHFQKPIPLRLSNFPVIFVTLSNRLLRVERTQLLICPVQGQFKETSSVTSQEKKTLHFVCLSQNATKRVHPRIALRSSRSRLQVSVNRLAASFQSIWVKIQLWARQLHRKYARKSDRRRWMYLERHKYHHNSLEMWCSWEYSALSNHSGVCSRV